MQASAYPDPVYPLSPEEAQDFGWATPGQVIPLVLTTRSPTGVRIIPTRELINGEYVYGFVSFPDDPASVESVPGELAYELPASYLM